MNWEELDRVECLGTEIRTWNLSNVKVGSVSISCVPFKVGTCHFIAEECGGTLRILGVLKISSMATLPLKAMFIKELEPCCTP
jgi:hypothetical protein